MEMTMESWIGLAVFVVPLVVLVVVARGGARAEVNAIRKVVG